MERLIRRLAEKSPHTYRHGALVTKAGSVLASGYNHHGLHAERSALGALWPSKRLGVTVWVGRITKAGSWALSKPCAVCEAFLKRSGVRKIRYSTPNGWMEM